MDVDSPLNSFLSAVLKLKQEYDQVGPGKVDPRSFEQVERFHALLRQYLNVDVPTTPLADRIETSAAIALEMSRRCGSDPAGLCFITGEAGLIPRRDYVDAFNGAIDELNRCLHQMPA